jgi:hypothetical protein
MQMRRPLWSLTMRNFSLLLLVCAWGISGLSFAQDDLQPDDEYARQTVIGYPSVQEALHALKAKPGVAIVTKPDGWIIATEPTVYAQWAFTPEGYYAHPAVVRRLIQQRPGGEVYVETSALCQPDKDSCDRLMAEFRAHNDGVGGKGGTGGIQ